MRQWDRVVVLSEHTNDFINHPPILEVRTRLYYAEALNRVGLVDASLEQAMRAMALPPPDDYSESVHHLSNMFTFRMTGHPMDLSVRFFLRKRVALQVMNSVLDTCVSEDWRVHYGWTTQTPASSHVHVQVRDQNGVPFFLLVYIL